MKQPRDVWVEVYDHVSPDLPADEAARIADDAVADYLAGQFERADYLMEGDR